MARSLCLGARGDAVGATKDIGDVLVSLPIQCGPQHGTTRERLPYLQDIEGLLDQ
jgi:hypothetical protein